MTRIKICCMASVTEMQLAVAAGAHAIGLVAQMPSGPGPISDELIATIAESAPPAVATFLLSSETSARALQSHVARTGVNTLQIVRHVDLAVLEFLRTQCAPVRLVQVVHVEDASSIALARSYARFAHGLLLDSGRPSANELGGTGRVHDWSLSRQIVESVDVPVFLAGGLTPENVADAVTAVRPFGVDVCSGLRTDGALDPEKLSAFMRAARAA